jgi:HK97 gp10 family phage protein
MGNDRWEAERSAARFRQRLASIPLVVQDAALKTVITQAGAMAATMRSLVPVDQGDLKESITVTGPRGQTPKYSQPGGSMIVPPNGAAITVGNSDVRYGHLVEYGTAHAAAQPFFWPAVRLHRKKATTAIKSAVGRAVRKNWGKG